jgi:hypothetical protein
MLKGVAASDVLRDFLALGAFTAVFTTVSILGFRKRLA